MRVAPATHYRADIDGLRGIAVLAVIAYHAFPSNVRGGFVGVDVFFVISGYLISGIILGALSQNQFTFTDFYTRRVRRIVPALTIVVTATLAFGWFALFADEYLLLGKHAASAAAFVSNLVLWRESGYFDTASELKPLLHLWSLGVEEQFYLCWPVALYVAWRRKWRLRGLIATVAAASFLLNVLLVTRRPVATFYLPFTRFWELMAGAFLAYRTGGSRSVPMSLAEAQSVAGLGLVLASVIGIDRSFGFPGVWAVLPVAGTSMLIGAKQSQSWINRRLLSYPVIVFIGLVSYPLYLWHWPLFALFRIVESKPLSEGQLAAAAAISLALATVTYLLVERPVRRLHAPALILTGLPLLLAISGVAGWVVYQRGGIPARFAVPADQFVQGTFWNVDACKERYAFARSSYCGLSSLDTEPSVMVLGDSHSRAYFAGLSEYYARRGQSLVSFGIGGCPPALGTVRPLEDAILDCDAVTRHALDYLKDNPKITTVIIAASFADYPTLLRRQDGRDEAGEAIFTAGLDSTITEIESARRKVVLLHQVPVLGMSPKLCTPRPFRITDAAVCKVALGFVTDRFAEYKRLVARILEHHPRVVENDPMKVFCDGSWCYAERDKTILYADDNHINRYGSELFGRAVQIGK